MFEGLQDIEFCDVISSLAMKCCELKRIHLEAELFSCDIIYRIEDRTRDLALKKAEFDAIASLPRLKLLGLACEIEIDAASPLAICKGLKYIHGVDIDFLKDLLPVIGENLISLKGVLKRI